MEMNGSSKLGHVLMLLLLLGFIFHHTESDLPSDHDEQISITGRRMMMRYYKPNAQIETPPSRSRRGGGGHYMGGG
ncbi:uncharacterized protein LOC111829077 [Capsella rubella]|uniref:uncharacterized protein LOC111829077 n=1 Tax=Capsella rubella TaxID=81985 RepID=UPI000CD4B516|nr:uncharacterized protein LOC111829077 [Capsella rubella]